MMVTLKAGVKPVIEFFRLPLVVTKINFIPITSLKLGPVVSGNLLQVITMFKITGYRLREIST